MKKKSALPKNKYLIAYCGIDCSKCFSYRMTVSDAAKSLRRELRSVGLKHFWHEIPILGRYEPFKKSLDGLAMMRCPKGCRGGGGNPWCKIRRCCVRRKFSSCIECDIIAACAKLAPITKGYKNRNLKNLEKLENT